MRRSKGRPKVRYITSVTDWAVLLMPVRFEIIAAMRDIAPCSIADVAERIERDPDTLYRHFQSLERAGFVVRVEKGRVAGRAEQIYDLAADDFFARPATASAVEVNDSVRRTAGVVLKLTDTVVARAAGKEACRTKGARRNVHCTCDYLWLTPEQFRRLSVALHGAIAACSPRRKPGASMHIVSLVAAPVVRRSRGAPTHNAR